ncbi:MAG: hypothetical protein L0Y72_19985 [Gemmataceae bacterium]|nr:hypothetical protein [Gemmataceae bacterium]MCI0741317.1 hypothetical protein [Gemmataceae bacterium]
MATQCRSKVAQDLSKNQLADALTTPRCPLCRHFLVARLGRRGAYFHCACRRKPARADAARKAA